MGQITITKNFYAASVLTDATATYGVTRNDTSGVVVASGTAMTHVSTGTYSATWTEPAASLVYTLTTVFVYGGETYTNTDTITATSANTASISGNVKVSDVMRRIYTMLPKGAAYRANIHAVNQVIEYIRTFGDWPFLESVGELTLTPEYSTGTVSVAASGTTVTGVGTTFTAGMVGRRIRMGGNEDYQIASYSSPTSIAINTGAISAASGSTFSIYQETYQLDSTVQNVVEVRDVTNRRTIPRMSAIEGGRMNNWINVTGQYRLGAFSFSRASTTTSTPQLTIVPPPLNSALIRYLYIKRLETVTGPSDTIGVPDTMLECLVQGVYAQILRQNAVETWTQEYNLFKDQLTKRLAVEQPIEAVRIQMTRRDAISPDYVPVLYTTLQPAP